MTQKITGVQRYAFEIVHALDKYLDHSLDIDKVEYILIAPKKVKHKIKLKHIKLVNKGCFNGQLWEQIELPLYVKSNFLFNLGNCAPLIKKNQTVFFHDAATVRMPETFTTLFKLWYRIQYSVLGNRLEKLFTVSNFSKKEISCLFNININKFYVANCGIEHIFRVKKDNNIFVKCNIKENYVLAVSSLMPSKNFKLILKAAKLLPNYNFIIVGGIDSNIFNVEDFKVPSNVHFIGYVSDEELVALYSKAECFVYPSLYEGFGIPPLEAIANNCPCILSNIEVFKEIYGERVLYCEKDNPESLAEQIKNKKELIKIKNINKDNFLINKYSWNKTLEKILKVINRGMN